MSYVIAREPAYVDSIVGQDLIYSANSSEALVGTNYKYKYTVTISIGYGGPSGTLTEVAFLTFSPNADGIGIIDISNIIEEYVQPDNTGQDLFASPSRFKTPAYNKYTAPHPIHLIDCFCLSDKTAVTYSLEFGEQWAATATGAVVWVTAGASTDREGILFNGTDYGLEQVQRSGDYGINPSAWNTSAYHNPTVPQQFVGIALSGQQRFLTTYPARQDGTQYNQLITDNDYHTLAFTAGWWLGYASLASVINIEFFDSSNVSLLDYDEDMTALNGGYDGSTDTTYTNTAQQVQYFGCGPANFLGRGTTIPATWDYYHITLRDGSGSGVGPTYTFKKQQPDCKGYETIRLTWLNKLGAWDYYNFTKKNLRTTKIKRPEFTKTIGSWNDGGYSKASYQRGRAILETEATETIKCNSNWFRDDLEAEWIEQLFISNDVYMIRGYNSEDVGGHGAEYGYYLTPVIVKDKKYERYTEANDKVAQYEIEIEYAYNKRIQKA